MSYILSIHRFFNWVHWEELHYIDASFCNLYTFWRVTFIDASCCNLNI